MTNQTGQARGNLMRSERQLSQSKMGLKSAKRNRIVGGVILLIGLIVLILLNVVVGVVVMLVGGWVFFSAMKQIGQERSAMVRMTERITDESAKLNELTSNQPAAD